MIFIPQERYDWSIKNYNESSYQFLQRSPWPLVGLIREWINEWVTPFENDNDFISKFKSKSDKQHDAAGFEMLLYTLLSNSGLDIDRIARGNGKTPDFRLTTANGKITYLECSLAANALESEEDRKKINSVLQYIDEIPGFPFVISVRFEAISDTSISKRKLLKFLDQFRPPFDFSEYKHETYYEEDGWEIEIALTKKTICSKRTLGAFSRPAKTIDNFRALYNALNDKLPGKYGVDGHGYINCLCIDDLSVNEGEFFTALFGPQHMDRIRVDLQTNAFFLSNGKPINTNVSAVMFCKGLKPFQLLSTEVSLWHNPFSIIPVDSRILPVKEVRYLRDGEYLLRDVIESDRSIFQLLKKLDELYIEYHKMEYRRDPNDHC